MKRPEVCVIIPYLNEACGLADCLASLAVVRYPEFSVVMVHDGPAGPGPAFAARPSETAHTGGNIGFAGAANIGLGLALKRGADYAFLLNDDAVVSPEVLDVLVDEAERDAGVGMLGPEVMDASDRERISFSGARFDPLSVSFSFPRSGESASSGRAPSESDYISGCALLVKRRVLETVGALDERFFLYWEDCDWGLRAKKAGFGRLVVPAARIWHRVSATTGADSPMKAYHKARGRLLFASIHAPSAVRRVLAAELRDAAWVVLRSGEPGSLRLAAARLAGAAAYFSGRSGSGPEWLRPRKDSYA